ncbi:MAG: nucleotidyltransferase family protein [Candidatus Nealsonbacteria bacterium]|nr:nucleotidyltransferase family protein [Candidatus Nealsonbacteria bacterium]
MTKTEQLLQILEKNPSVQAILNQAGRLKMPNWYLGAGGIVQTAWNVWHGFDPENGIKDYDLVYYDAGDTSYEGEDLFIQKGKELFKDISVPVEIRNQARVYLWYEKHFGRPIEQSKSVEEAIGAWPTTATSVGVRKEKNGELRVYAPFGLDDLLGMVVRANKAQITEKIYRDKVERWIRIWPNLKVIPWEE